MRIIRFRLCKLKWLKFFSLWYPTSRAKTLSSTNLAYCMDLSLSLAFSGLVVLVCDWLHSVGQNHFYVMMLLNRDSVIFKVFLFRVILLKDFEQMHRFQVRAIRSLAFIRTTWYSIRTLNYQSIIRPDDENFPSGPSSMSRSFKLLQVASVWMSQQHDRTPFSVRQGKRFHSKTQIWEDSCNRPNDVCSCPDAILDRASRTYKVQLSGRASLNMEIVCHRSSTVRTSASKVRMLKP
jgi:hypothetical protein